MTSGVLRRWLHRRAVPLLIIGLLVTTACDGDQQQAGVSPDGSAAPGTEDPSPDDASTDGGPTEDAAADRATDERNGVEVLDQGTEPRQRLLLEPEVGTQLERTLSTSLGITLEIDGEELPSPSLPGTRIVLRSQVEEVAADGTIRTTLTFLDVAAVDAPGVDPAVLAQTDEVVGQMAGLTATATSDRHGGSQEIVLDTGAISDPQLRSSLEALTSQFSNFSTPLPAEPLGVGGSWRVSGSANLNGIQTDTATTYTLESRSGNEYTLSVAQEATAPPGSTELPGLPPDVEASIVSFVVNSTGEVEGRLDQPLPDLSTIQGSGNVELVVEGAGTSETVLQQLTIDVSLGP